MKKLYRSREERMLGGVCGGIAEYFSIDPTLVRLAFVLFFFADGAGILAYVVGWFIIPEKKDKEKDPGKEYQEDPDYSKGENQGYHEYHEYREEKPDNTKKNSSESRKDPFSTFKLKDSSQKMWGILLVIIGGFFLFRYWFPFVMIEKMWPLLIILLGLAFIFKSKNEE